MASGRYSSIATGIAALASALYMAGCATFNVNVPERKDDIPMNHAYLFPAGMQCVEESQTIINGFCPYASGIRENVFYDKKLPRITVKAFYERKAGSWKQNPIEVRITEESTALNDLGQRIKRTQETTLRDDDCDGRIDSEKYRTYSNPFNSCRR